MLDNVSCLAVVDLSDREAPGEVARVPGPKPYLDITVPCQTACLQQQPGQVVRQRGQGQVELSGTITITTITTGQATAAGIATVVTTISDWR